MSKDKHSEFEAFAKRKLGGGMDIEDLVLRHAAHGETQEHLQLQPTTAEFANCRPTEVYIKQRGNWKRTGKKNTMKHELLHDFSNVNETTMSEVDAVREAARCLGCADAPCQKSCPTAIDIKAFIQCIANRNWYGAAKIIMNDNPCGLTCGRVCMTNDSLCTSSCTLAGSHNGPINISGLQEFAMTKFKQMGIIPTLAPEIASKPRHTQKVAFIGLGPATIGCATFLARMGYDNLHIFEREKFGGGLSSTEIPQFRCDHEGVEYEVQLLQVLGVHIHYEHALVKNPQNKGEFNLNTLKQDGFEAIFVGIGRDKPLTIPEFGELTVGNNYFTSKDFLPDSCKASKKLLNHRNPTDLPKLHGRVVVLGGGDVAADCATTAFRCGAEHVSLVFRKNTTDLRALPEEIEHMMHEQVDLIPYCAPKAAILNDDGKVKIVEFYKQEKGLDGQYYTDPEQYIRLKCDYLITAFGSLADTGLINTALAPVTTDKYGLITVDHYGATSVPGVFAGGDVIGATTTVGSVNDGKVAAWGIHAYLQQIPDSTKPQLPLFHTHVDDVDLSVTVAGVKFPNPFGLASAPPTTSKDMISRAFKAGWGFAVTKTFTIDDDLVTNVSPRIMSSLHQDRDYEHRKHGWMNIELVSEKYADYWYHAISDLKQEHPAHVVVASIMAGSEQSAWVELAVNSEKAGADMIEMNLSCPHGMHEQGMGLELGVYPDKVFQVVKWVVDAVKIPVFAKLTPNITDITTVAEACQKAGAAGVTAINTVSGFVGFQLNDNVSAMRWGVGNQHDSCYGGLCGPNVRPMALRAVTAIKNKLPDLNIMATGGIDTADSTMMFLLAGAPLMQICTAVMNQDYTVVNDFISGLKTLLYIHGRRALHGMDLNGITVDGTTTTTATTAAPVKVCCGGGGCDDKKEEIKQDQSCQSSSCCKNKEQPTTTVQSRFKTWSSQSPPLATDVAFNGKTHLFGSLEKARVQQGMKERAVWKIDDVCEDDLDVVRAEATVTTIKPVVIPVIDAHNHKSTSGGACCPSSSPKPTVTSPVSKNPITTTTVVSPTTNAASVSSVIGEGLARGRVVKHVGLSRTQQVVALIDDDLCLRCGRCYMACNDNAYQAISMKPDTHQVKVKEDTCTGCGICESVCPAPKCITFVPRDDFLSAYRGDEYRGTH